MHLWANASWVLLASAGVSADSISSLKQRPILRPSEHDMFTPSFDSFVEDTIKQLHIPGLSIAVIDNGKIASKGYGFAILPDQKATPDTQYFTASTTKAFTAAAAAILVHDNDKYPSMQWTTPINQLIRADFVLEDEYATSHTIIEDALSHRTGLAGHDLILGQTNDTPSTTVQKMRDLPMTAQPRTQWQYCNMMYAVITDLVQTVTGIKLETYLRENIWEPLGMLSTTFQIPSDEGEKSRLARGYYWYPQDQEHLAAIDNGGYVPDVYLDLLTTGGDGATISTVNDYALWIKALLNAAGDEESWNSSSPITRNVYHDLVTPRAIIPGPEWQASSDIVAPLTYALGWATAQNASAQVVTHGGGITGFGTQIYMLPGLNFGVVTMGNTFLTSNDAGDIIASKLIVEKLNLTAKVAANVSSVGQSLLDVQRAGRNRRLSKSRQRDYPSIIERPPAHSAHLPLPLPLASFAGLYSHPAYGKMNLTIPSSKSESSQRIVLETVFDRVFVEKEILTHISGTLFDVRSFEPHGLGDIVSGEGIVWQDITDYDWEARAIFEFGIDGETIERVGMDLDPDMVETARRKGKKYWRDGMVWFDKV